MSAPIRVGTRKSALALAQCDSVVRTLRTLAPTREVAIRPMTTAGDRDRRRTASPDFTDAIEEALLRQEIDLAVHSAKDLPARLRSGLTLAAFPRRADPRDCFVLREARSFSALPSGARLGSSSLRRQAQLLAWRPDIEVVPVRGNVDSRLAHLARGDLAGIVLAVAGLARLGRADVITEVADPRALVPAPGQGALAIEVRTKDRSLLRLVRALDHGATRAAVTAERSFSASLGGECNLPLGSLARARGGRLRLVGDVLSPDGRRRIRGSTTGPTSSAHRLGVELGRRLRANGAGQLLSEIRSTA
ncbi:MAG: hydroxymethylbilane synthase [Thermoplasmata archaeon]|nr:hydroxymethylbilane synthase [Thermoplasmata archaeon]